MPTTPSPQTRVENPDKATARSISFTSDSLYLWAKQFGQKCSPKQSASTVVCTALSEYRQRHEPTTDEAQLLVAARKVGIGRAIAAIASLRRPSRRPAA